MFFVETVFPFILKHFYTDHFLKQLKEIIVLENDRYKNSYLIYAKRVGQEIDV